MMDVGWVAFVAELRCSLEWRRRFCDLCWILPGLLILPVISECDRKRELLELFFLFKKANNYIHSWQMERIVLKTSQKNKNRNHGRRTGQSFDNTYGYEVCAGQREGWRCCSWREPSLSLKSLKTLDTRPSSSVSDLFSVFPACSSRFILVPR
jgi:hypothetical protein